MYWFGVSVMSNGRSLSGIGRWGDWLFSQSRKSRTTPAIIGEGRIGCLRISSEARIYDLIIWLSPKTSDGAEDLKVVGI